MSKASLRRRFGAAMTVGGVLVLGTALGTGAAPAQPTEVTADAVVQSMPAELKEAIRRDLGKDAKEYVATARAADKAALAGSKLRKELGEKFGGAWFDKNSKKLHVAVTDAAVAAKVRAAGGEVHQRAVSAAALDRAADTISKWAKSLTGDKRNAFQAVAVDTKDGKLGVTLSTSEAGKALAAELPKVNVQVEVGHKEEELQPEKDIRGGDGYTVSGTGSSLRLCSLGFNAVDKLGRGQIITAGHCFDGFDGRKVNVEIKGAGNPVGEAIGLGENVRFDNDANGDDSATIKVTNGAQKLLPEVNRYNGGGLKLDGLTDPIQGQEICKSGRTTGWQCGNVVNTDVSVKIGGHLLSLFQHDACSIPGDSGGAVVLGSKALGITSGGAANPGDKCPTAGQPKDRSYAELVQRDILPDYKGDAQLTVLTANGDEDEDGVLDINELNADITKIKDTNNNGVAAYRDADEPNLSAPKLTSPADKSRITERKPVLTGTAKPNATVSLTYKGQTKELKADASGKWTEAITTDLAYGGHEITLKQKAGDLTSREVKSTFTVVPSAPVITEPKEGAKSENARPTVAGTGTAGAVVTVTAGDVKLGEATVGADSKWSVTPAADLAKGKHTISAKQTIDKVDSDADTVAYELTKGGAAVPPTTSPAGNGGGNGGLAKTGVDNVLPMLIGGGVAVAGGVALLVFFRRRKAGAES
ncbi:Ig-like domain-containing protein [Crossiella sp. SN42]|uniref:S1 family peptidase n=1 Tax=Crossiella sp. SN42 TaxID=2944808 RepID=UPI00207CC1F7|nr:Ig-like domain-containing protein [Crossiella sp. SN42]MCO1579642.1 Ig-like domain-containing protein [Crossiella sp. SN42]